MSSESLPVSGIYEFVFGSSAARRDPVLEYWSHLGFHPIAEGSLGPSDSNALYGQESQLTSLRLEHAGCRSFETGYVRLQFWDQLLNDGLGQAKPLDVGSRWMGLYTKDILQLRDAFADTKHNRNENWWVSPLVRAALEWPEPAFALDRPFIGLRELVVLSDDFRHAFIQRGGFDRPGFGTFDDALPFKNTEGTHANIVQPAGGFSTEFYKRVFGLVTAPFGEAEDAGDKPSTIDVLDLAPGQMFRIERLTTPGCPTGMIQVYAPHGGAQDCRSLSRPGSRGLCFNTYRVRDIAALKDLVSTHGAMDVTDVRANEFGESSLCFTAPDGIAWGSLALTE